MKGIRKGISNPIKSKLTTLVVLAMAPLLIIICYLIYSLLNYSKAYEEIVDNMTVANNYNVYFKESMDESLYKLVVGYVTFDNISSDSQLVNPYIMIGQAVHDFKSLMNDTERESRSWLQSLLKNLDSLKNKVDILKENIEEGGHYDENMQMLESDVYILTDLVQDDIQYYIYYQTKDIQELQQNLHRRVIFFIIFWASIALLIVIFVIIRAIIISRGIITPLERLVNATSRIATGDFKNQVEVNSDDEISVLADSVNNMTEQLDVMVDTIKEDEAKMRHAELRLLQEQINPHFLYNTLDTIVWLVESGDNERAIDVVMSLSEFFRLSLSKGQDIISIKEEEAHVRSYLNIQHVRYHDILEYSIEIDPKIYIFEIQKLTLQPLVENSLYHGIKYKRAKGKILVKGFLEEDRIVFLIEDDGVGIEKEALLRLQNDIAHKLEEKPSGFGLTNVNQRIKMHFGEEYGMEISSTKGVGTTIRIVIPAIPYSAKKEIKDE